MSSGGGGEFFHYYFLFGTSPCLVNFMVLLHNILFFCSSEDSLLHVGGDASFPVIGLTGITFLSFGFLTSGSSFLF